MKVDIRGTDKLEKKLRQKSETDFIAVSQKSARDIYTRSQKAGGTPVGDYKGGGQLRKSARYRGDEVGYTTHYSPHVEYGHRLVSGGYVPGQYFFKRNVDTQRPIYKQDLKNKLKE